MHRLLIPALLLFASSLFAQLSTGISQTAPYNGIPSQTFRLTTRDSAVVIPDNYLGRINSNNFGMFMTVEDNDVRVAWNGIPTWERFANDTVNKVAITKDSTFGRSIKTVKVTATGHHLLDSMVVFFSDSVKQWQNKSEGYRVLQHVANSFIIQLPYPDTFIASTPKASARVYTADNGHRLPEGLLWKFDRKEQIQTMHVSSADSAKPASVIMTIFDIE